MSRRERGRAVRPSWKGKRLQRATVGSRTCVGHAENHAGGGASSERRKQLGSPRLIFRFEQAAAARS
eukprot:13397517-Alexandrium_andersonii.AAC.1